MAAYKEFRDGKFDGKIAIKDAVGISNAEILSLMQVGYLFYAEGKLDRAETVFNGIAALDPDNRYIHSALGALLARKGDNPAALEELNKGLEKNPNDIAAYVNRGEVLFKMKRVDESARDFKKALDLDPQKKSPAANRARVILMGMVAVAQKARKK